MSGARHARRRSRSFCGVNMHADAVAGGSQGRQQQEIMSHGARKRSRSCATSRIPAARRPLLQQRTPASCLLLGLHRVCCWVRCRAPLNVSVMHASTCRDGCDARSPPRRDVSLHGVLGPATQDEIEDVADPSAHLGDSVRRSPRLFRPIPSNQSGHPDGQVWGSTASNSSPIEHREAWQDPEAYASERPNPSWGRSLKRAWYSLGSSLHLLDSSETIRPRAGGKLGKSFRKSLSKLYGDKADDTGLECKAQIGEGTCGLVFRALYNGRPVAAKVIKRTEQYEAENTCPVDAKESFERFFDVLCRCSNRTLRCPLTRVHSGQYCSQRAWRILTSISVLTREIVALQRCVHPNIVALITTERTANGNPIMVLEWLRCTLEEHFERKKGFLTGSYYQAPARC